MFKTIAEVEPLTIQLSDAATETLEQRRSLLSQELGFDVTASQTIAWMLKHWEDRPVKLMYNESSTGCPPVAVPSHLEPFLPRPGSPERTAIDNAVEGLMAKGQKLQAIKLLRERCPGMGLRAMKDYAELYYCRVTTHTALSDVQNGDGD